MISDFAFPGTLLIMKFGFRVVVHREFSRVELFRTGLLFPIDVIFLAFTFCSAVLVNMQKKGHQISDVKSLMMIFCWLVIATFITIVLSRDAEKQFDIGKNISCMIKFTISCLLALSSLGISTALVGSI